MPVCVCVRVGWACGSWESFVCVLHAIYPQQNELMDVFFHLGHIRSEIQGQHLITLERSESESCFIARRCGILLVQMFIRTFAQISYKVSSFFKIQTGWRLDRLVVSKISPAGYCAFFFTAFCLWIYSVSNHVLDTFWCSGYLIISFIILINRSQSMNS